MSQQQQPGRRRLEDVIRARAERRRERLQAEIRRNRRGDHAVPTWVLAVILFLVVAGWVYLVVSS